MQSINTVDRFSRSVVVIEVDLPFDEYDIPVLQSGELVAAGQGDTDAGVTTMGMLVGAALVQNWGLGGTPAGTPPAAQIAVLSGIFLLVAAGLLNRRRGYGIAPEYQLGLD